MVNKYKEFWIWGFKIGDDESISQSCSVHLDSGGSQFFDPVHHVIEYAAVEDARVVAEKAQCDLLAAKEEIKALRDALEFYADEDNWRENTLNDLSDPLVKRDIKCPNGDMDSYGYLEDDGSNRLNIVGGKTARQALKESKERLGEL